MKYRVLGSTGLKVSEIGMGCAALGGGVYQKNDREAVATLNEALDAGINFFDTASSYSDGHSERLIGRAFPGRRNRVIIASKAGMLYPPAVRLAIRFKYLLMPVRAFLGPIAPSLNRIKYGNKHGEFSPAHITESLHGSLKRLATDYIDLYQVHNPPPEELQRDDLCEVFEQLKRQGKLRHYGISLTHAEDAAALGLRHPGAAAIQVMLNLLDQEAITQCLPLAQARSMAVIARVPLAQGLLTGATGGTKAERITMDRAQTAARKERVQQFRFLATGQRTLAQAALRFVLQTSGVSITLSGMSSRRHLHENLKALEVPPLSMQELDRITASVR